MSLFGDGNFVLLFLGDRFFPASTTTVIMLVAVLVISDLSVMPSGLPKIQSAAVATTAAYSLYSGRSFSAQISHERSSILK
jgi:membrane protein implicated in regulation of membrane protease activity